MDQNQHDNLEDEHEEGDELLLSCSKCDEIFRSKKALRTHVKKDTEKSQIRVSF